MTTAARKPSPVTRAPRIERLTFIAFILAVGLVTARLTLIEYLRPVMESLTGPAVPDVGGPAPTLCLDLLCWVPALLVMARRVSDRTYVLRWSWSLAPLLALTIWMGLSVTWSADKFAAAIAACNFAAAVALFWAAMQLVRSWTRLRLLAAAVFGMILVLAAHGFIYRIIDTPDNIKYWNDNKEQILKERGWAADSFAAKQFEINVKAGSMNGFYNSANTCAAVTTLLILVGAGWLVQRLRDREGEDWGIAIIAVALVAGAWLLAWTASRAAIGTLIIGLLIGALLWFKGDAIAKRAKAAYFAGAAIILTALAGVAGYGLIFHNLVHSSLTFRWWYWIGAAKLIAHHPLAGVGWANFGPYYLGVRMPIASEEVKDPHNFLIRIFCELGVIAGLCAVAWIARMWWDLTRPIAPPAPAKSASPAPVGSRPVPTLAVIAAISLMFWLEFGIDWTQDSVWIFNEAAKRFLFFCLMLIGSTVVAIRGLKDQSVDDRPAPWLLAGILISVGMFMIHGLVDFGFSETSPLCLFALLAGAALGVRQPSAAGRPRRTAVAAIAFAAITIAWLIIAGFFWIPTVQAEAAAHEANQLLRQASNNQSEPQRATLSHQAVSLLLRAREFQPLNADYPARAAQIALLLRDRVSFDSLMKSAIAINPMEQGYYVQRARGDLLLDPAASTIPADYEHALSIDPCNVSLRLEYASILSRQNDAQANSAARRQMQQALWYDDQLDPKNLKRLTAQQRAEIEKRIRP